MRLFDFNLNSEEIILNVLLLRFENINQIYQVDFTQWWFCLSGYEIRLNILLYIMLESSKSTPFHKICIVQKVCARYMWCLAWLIAIFQALMCRLNNWIISFSFCVNHNGTWAIKCWTPCTIKIMNREILTYLKIIFSKNVWGSQLKMS